MEQDDLTVYDALAGPTSETYHRRLSDYVFILILFVLMLSVQASWTVLLIATALHILNGLAR